MTRPPSQAKPATSMAAAANRYEQIVVAREPQRLRTSATPEHCTMTAGRLSMSPFQTRRA